MMVSDIYLATMAYVCPVLILVLMDDGLWLAASRSWSITTCLNPCFNGWWSLTNTKHYEHQPIIFVLILVLMDDGLWPLLHLLLQQSKSVLILVLMDDGLWPILNQWISTEGSVLILVLMDDDLWPVLCLHRKHTPPCLNPCFNGWWSLTLNTDKTMKASE